MKKELVLLLFVFCLFVNSASSQKVTLTITTVSDCKPLNVKASASTSGFKDPIEKYEWDFGDEIITTVDNKIDYIYTTAGTKNIFVTVYAGGIVRVSTPQVLTVQDLCIEDGTKKGGNGGFSFTHGECGAPFTVQFNDDYSTTRANNSVVTEWDFGDGTILSGTDAKTSVSHTYTTNETSIYFVTVKRKDKTTGQPLASGTKRIILVNELAKFKVKNDLSDELCTETRVNFLNDGMNGLGIKKFEWDFGDDKKYTVNNTDFDPAEDGATSHQYNVAGSFPVTLKVTDRAGCTSAFTFPQNIRIKGPKADFSNSKSVGCGDQFSIAFTDLSTPGVRAPLADWKWYIDNTIANSYAVSESSRIAALSFSNSGTYKKYSVKLIVRDADGCPSTLSKTNVIEGSNPKTNFNSDESNACAPVTLHFTNTSQVNNSNTNYVWTFGQGDSTSTSKDASFDYRHGGLYKTILQLTDSYGCTDEKAIPLKVNGPYGKITADTFTGSIPFTFKPNLTSSGFSYVKWDWKDNSQTNTDLLAVQHVYNEAGIFKPAATLYDTQGCSFYTEVATPVVVEKINAAFSIDKTLFCGSGTIYVTDLSSISEGSAIAEYLWDFGDGTTSTSATPAAHTYTKPGTYNLSLTIKSTSGRTSTSVSKPVVLLNNPTITLTGPQEKCVLQVARYEMTTKLINDDITGQYIRYYDLQGNQYTKSVPPGEYIVAAVAETRKGCKDSVTQKLIVHPLPDLVLTSDTTICKGSSITLSASGAASYNWSVDGIAPIPNPSTGNLLITPTSNTIYSVRGTSIYGCVKDSSISVKIDMPVNLRVSLAAGICEGGSTDLWAKSNNNTFIWNNENSLNDPHSATPVAAPDATTTYTVKGISNNACPDETDSILVTVFKKPTIRIDGKDINCLQPAVLALDYTAAVGSEDAIKSYTWKLDNAYAGSAQNLNVDFRRGGMHELKLIAVTEKGCTDSISKPIIIDSVRANFSVLDSIKCGDNKPFSFENTTSSVYPLTDISWEFGNKATGNDASVQHTYASAGRFPVALFVKTVNNCVDQITKGQAVIIYNKPVITIAADKEKCFKELFDYSATVDSEDEIINQQLHIYSSEGKEMLQPLSTGNYNLAYVVTTLHGCKDSVAQSLIVHPLPNLAFNCDTVVCKNTTASLSASGATSYLWTTDGDTFIHDANTANATITPAAGAHYFVRGVNEYGCVKDSSVVVKIAEPVSISISPDITICEGDQTRLGVKGNTNNFLWDNTNTLNNSLSAAPIASPLISTTYVVKAFSNNVCPDEIDSVKVTVAQKPAVSLGPDITVSAGSVVALRPAITGNIISYKWEPSSGLSCSDCAKPNVTVNQNTTYALTVKTNDGCSVSDDINIHVLPNKNDVYIPDAFTPNGDGKNDVFYIMGNGIRSVKSFSIFDRWGKQVFHKQNFNANDRSAGWNGVVHGEPVKQTTTFVYLAEIISEDGKTISLKGTVVLIR